MSTLDDKCRPTNACLTYRRFLTALATTSICVLGALVPSLAFAQAESPTTYQPSPWRIEGGPILFLSPPGNDLWGFGGTVSVHYAVGAQRLFFFGGRLAFLGGAEGNYGGSGGIADVDVGLRPRLATWHTGAFALVFAGGVGGAFIESPAASGPFPSPAWLFHLAMRVGPSFDIGAFTLDALAGPVLLVDQFGGAGGPFVECILDLGVRF